MAAVATYGAALATIAVSLLVGQAVLVACGWTRLTWISGPVGLAVILVASGIAIKMPGHATAVAITFGVLITASLAVLAVKRPLGAHPAIALLSAALALLGASIPFIVNGRIGILGVGLVNDDMASHLLIADWLSTRVGEMPSLIHQGYPVGPHAFVAGLDASLGTGLIDGFAGLTLALPALTALVAFEALSGLRRPARVVSAALVALPYLAAAYLGQEAFKEPIEAVFLLGFALLLAHARTARAAIPLGVIAAGAVYAYSFPGLFWLAGAAVLYLGLAVVTGAPEADPPSRVRGMDAGRSPGANAAIPAGVAVVVLLVLTAPEWSRLVDFTSFRAFKSATISGGLGNLRHQVSPLEALGIWPASDFRLSASDATAPAAGFYLGALIALGALVVALPRWIARHGPAVPAALAAAIVAYVGARLFGTVYTSAKALAIAAPLVTLISFGGLLAPESVGGGGAAGARPANFRSRIARTVRGMDAERSPGADPATRRGRDVVRRLLAAALAAAIVLSSFLVLRQAPVGPTSHADQLAELRPLVEGRKVLFLGRDNFIAYELRGARAFTAVRNFYDPNYVRPNLRLRDVFRKFDFDSVPAAKLAQFPFVITTSAAYASGPPPSFRPLRTTPDFVLWKRVGPVGPRHTLPEGANPGATLQCANPAGRRASRAAGSATLFSTPPVVGGTWSPSSTVKSGSPSSQSLTLPAGRWEISLQYDATRPLHVSANGFGATLPANLDYRGSVPYYPAGELIVTRRGPVRFRVEVERPPLAGRLLGTKSEAHLGALAASPAAPGGPIPGEAERSVPPRRACGGYLDWYGPVAGR